MKRITFVLSVLFFLLCISCTKEKKEDILNIDSIMNNKDCLLTKQFTVGSDKNTTLVYFDQDCVTIEFIPHNANKYNLKREYYFYRNNNIYNTTTSLTKRIDGDKFGVGNDFNKLKKLLQLSFIYVNFTSEGLVIDDLYTTIMNDENITSTFKSELGFYDNVRNYYNSIFPIFNNETTKYKIDNYDVIVQNNKFKMINAYFDEYSLVVVNSELPNYEKTDLTSFKEYEVDKYIETLFELGNVSSVTMKDDLLQMINPSDTSNNIVRRVSGYYADSNDSINYTEKIIITEYESKDICKNVYELYLNNYLQNYYIGYKDNLLFILSSSIDDSKYKNILDVEFKTPTKYCGTNISLEQVTSFYSNGLLYNSDFAGKVFNNFTEYQNFVEKVKSLDSANNIDNSLNLITQEGFNNSKYIVVQLRIKTEGKANKYKYKLISPVLNNSILNIAYEKQIDATESYVEDNCCLYTIYKVSNDINISSINANALTII